MTSTPDLRIDSAEGVETAGAPCDRVGGGCGLAALSRRGLLRTAGVAGVVAVAGAGLSACGHILSPNENAAAAGSEPTTTGAAPMGAAPMGSAPMGGPTGTESSKATESTKAAGTTTRLTGTFLAQASSIPVHGGVIFADHQVVVTQPAAGTYKAFSTTCTHAGCQCNRVSGGKIACPCHGAAFSITDGSAVQGPTSTPLPARTIAVQNGQIRLQA